MASAQASEIRLSVFSFRQTVRLLCGADSTLPWCGASVPRGRVRPVLARALVLRDDHVTRQTPACPQIRPRIALAKDFNVGRSLNGSTPEITIR
jgi:hypothetical protein